MREGGCCTASRETWTRRTRWTAWATSPTGEQPATRGLPGRPLPPLQVPVTTGSVLGACPQSRGGMHPGHPHPATRPVYPVNRESGSGSHPSSAAHLTGPECPSVSEDTYRPVSPALWDCGAEQSMGSSDCFHNFPFSFGIFDASDIYLKFLKVIIFFIFGWYCCCTQAFSGCSKQGLAAWWGAQVLERSGSVVASWARCPEAGGIFRDQGRNLCVGRQIPSPWTTGEVPDVCFDGSLLYQPPFPPTVSHFFQNDVKYC